MQQDLQQQYDICIIGSSSRTAVAWHYLLAADRNTSHYNRHAYISSFLLAIGSFLSQHTCRHAIRHSTLLAALFFHCLAEHLHLTPHSHTQSHQCTTPPPLPHVLSPSSSSPPLQTFQEGTHLMVPWFDRPIIFDVRARPSLIQSQSGSRDLQMVRV